MTDRDIPFEYYGWWRIIETSQWDNEDIDIIGKALISITGDDDRLRMFVFLAHVNCKVTKTGVSFTWKGAWEYDPISGTGSVKLRKDGRLSGRIKIKNGDESTFIAERAENRKSLSLIRQATAINGGVGGERRLFSDLWKYEEAPNNRFHSDRAGRGVYSLLCAGRDL
jgi:hypothetical protein